MSQAVYIVGAKRTPIGAFMGALADVNAVTLGATALKGAIEHAGVDPALITEIYFGNVIGANLGHAPATQVALAAGLKPTTPATLVNKVCASGTKAIMLGASSIRLGENEIVAVGGMESMSQAPGLLPSFRTGNKYGNIEMLDAIVRDALQDPWKKIMMGDAGELLAEKYGFTREAQDEYAINSYKKAQAAQAAGKFASEITSVVIAGKKGDVVIDKDEEPNRADFAKMPTLRPAFKKDGTITAANASKINDGAAALILASEEAVKKYNLKPLARIMGYGDAAREPDWFTIAPADAIPIALKRAGMAVPQVDLWEINEAFSDVAMANRQILDIDPAKLNVNGGAVALGHPVGSSGARITVTLVHALLANGAKTGGVGICNGGGGASALIMEKA